MAVTRDTFSRLRHCLEKVAKTAPGPSLSGLIWGDSKALQNLSHVVLAGFMAGCLMA
jgi:hypothetical protein